VGIILVRALFKAIKVVPLLFSQALEIYSLNSPKSELLFLYSLSILQFHEETIMDNIMAP